MSSKDLNGLHLLPHFFENNIDSIKIEGRMKGHSYVGTVCGVYSEALYVLASGGDFFKKLPGWENQLNSISDSRAVADSRQWSSSRSNRVVLTETP